MTQQNKNENKNEILSAQSSRSYDQEDYDRLINQIKVGTFNAKNKLAMQLTTFLQN